MTYDFEDYGAPMEAEPPPGDEVLTLDEARERYQESVGSPKPALTVRPRPAPGR